MDWERKKRDQFVPTNYTWLLWGILLLHGSNSCAWTSGDQWRQERSGGPPEQATGPASLARMIPIVGMKSKHPLPLISLAREGDRHLGEAAPSPVAHENCLPGWQPQLGWRRNPVHPRRPSWQRRCEPFVVAYELRTSAKHPGGFSPT